MSSALRAECLANGRNMAVNLAARSGHFVLTEEFVSLLQLVTDLKDSDEDIVYAYVADRKGHVAHDLAVLVELDRPIGSGTPALWLKFRMTMVVLLLKRRLILT